MKTRAKLLFITGPGHSGTTLLDLLCGSIPGVFSMGEVHFLSWQLKQGSLLEDSQTWCSCGKDFKTCEVYGPILSHINTSKKIDIFSHPHKYDFSIERKLERYEVSFFKKIINKFLRLSITYKVFKPFSYIPYFIYFRSIKRNWDLFDSVANATECKYVVDSSKSFLRYWMLNMYRPNAVKLLVMKRDIKGVASSSHNGLSSEAIKTKGINWLHFYNNEIGPLRFINSNNWNLIDYEDLCDDPNLVQNKISKYLGFKSELSKEMMKISPYKHHTIQGNPIRLKKEDVVIRNDERWKNRLSDCEKKELDKVTMKLKYF